MRSPLPPPPTSTADHPSRGRRALLCGVSYKKQKHVNNMRDLLLILVSSILLLIFTHLQRLINFQLGRILKRLVKGSRQGDSLVFYFFGHGKRRRDYNGDETICPMDFEENGIILDNYISEAIVRPLIKDVTLHAIMDSCAVGCRGKWEDNSPPSGAYKGTNGGKAICFSASEDYLLPADTLVFSLETEMTGAITNTFINAVKDSLARNENITYQDIMDSMHQSIKQAGKSGEFFAGKSRIFDLRILQDPFLSSTEEFNTSKEFKL